MELYCLKCKAKKQCSDIQHKKSSNGRNMVSGKCGCGTKCNQFVKVGNNNATANIVPKIKKVRVKKLKNNVDLTTNKEAITV